MKTIFMGTPEFSIPTLENLFKNKNIELVKVVTMPNRKANRGQQLVAPPVAQFAIENNLPLIQTENINTDLEFQAFLKDNQIDLIIVLAFAQFLKENILNAPRLGCFNIHTSLLPKYRGAAPIQYAILNGDNTTGISIQKMVKKMDAGDLAHSKIVPIDNNETSGMLFSKLATLCGKEINNFIEKLITNKINFEKQNETQATFAPTINKEDGFIQFDKINFTNLKNKIRAFDPWPGTYCFLNNKRLKILSISKHPTSLKPGEITNLHGQLLIGLIDCTIRIEKLQLEGKKPTSDSELLNGFKDKLILTMEASI